jgi:hypothetical protein
VTGRAKSPTMTTEHEASRTLVKSPPELWAECSDAQSLGRHLDQFGDIRITRLEPETAVAWEGALASGTVRLEPSGWGTRVTLTVSSTVVEVAPGPEPVATGPEPVAAEPEPVAPGPELVAAAPDPERVAPRAVAHLAPAPPGVAAPQEKLLDPPAPNPVNSAPKPRNPPAPTPLGVHDAHHIVHPEPSVAEQRRGGLLAKLLGRFRPEPTPAPTVAEPPPSSPAPTLGVRDAQSIVHPEVPSVTEPEPGRVASEPDSGRVASEPDPEVMVTEPDPEVMASEPDHVFVASEPDPGLVASEPDSGPPVAQLDSEIAAPTSVADLASVLTAALESLGQAHHRPFSRA